jgi:hypothetical protein
MPSQGTIEAHTKSIRFHPYKSTRPDLLYKIKDILAVGSRDLGKKYVDQDVPEQEWVNLYSTAFEEYIQASTMYQAFLRETKTHYDKHIEELANRVLSYRDFDETLERKEKEHESTLQRSLLESKQRIRELEKSSANLNNNFGSMYSELQTTTEENKLLVDRMDSLKREVTSCKLTIQSLTQSLQRVDEEKSKAELKESSLTLELNDYRRHELTMAAENYELQKSIEEKNRIHGTLLHPSVLEAKHRENEALKEEHQRLLYIHRQLLVRFAALKYTIDGSITKIMTTRHEDEQEGVPSSERFHLESLVDKLLSEYRDVLRRESIKLLVDRKTPMEKLAELVTSTRFPQVLFESLMDHLELMMVEKAKILSDEAIQIGTRICMSSTCLSSILLLPSSQLLHHIASHRITGSDTIELSGDHTSVVLEGDFFEGCGVGPHVPVYLRFEGKVRNLRISRATILCAIHEVWIEKARQEGRPIEAAFLNITNGPMRVVPAMADTTDFELFKEHDRDSIVEVLKRNLLRLSAIEEREEQEEEDSSNSNAVSSARNALDAVVVEAPMHYVRLLPSLPPNATLAEFFNCYLRVSHF